MNIMDERAHDMLASDGHCVLWRYDFNVESIFFTEETIKIVAGKGNDFAVNFIGSQIRLIRRSRENHQ